MIEIPGLGGHPIVDGRIHRYSRERRGRKDSWYVLHQEGDKVWGAYGDWKTGERVSVREGELSRTQIARTMELVNRTREDDGRRAAMIAELRWSEAQPITDGLLYDHPYLVRKRVCAFGLRRDGWLTLLVPMRAVDGTMRGLQRIYPDGTKLFTKGCDPRGALHAIVGDLETVAVIAEGYATAASIRMATGLTCLVAFNAGNLAPVARAYRAAHPGKLIVIAADDDRGTACERHKREAREDGTELRVRDPRRPREVWCRCNPGLTAALEAAKEVKGRVVVPSIDGAGTDFNDIHLAHGLSEVARQVYGAL